MSRATIDRAQLQALLLSGEKVAAVAATLGCTPGAVSSLAFQLGLRLQWTTTEERTALADLRAGRALVVPADAAPAAARLAHRMAEALAEFRSGAVSAS